MSTKDLKPLSLNDLAEIVPRLELTMKMLVGEGAPATVAPTIAARQARAKDFIRNRQRRRVKRGSVQVKLLGLLQNAKSGMSLGQLMKAARASAGEVKYHLRKLRAKRAVRVVGTRKKARWTMVKGYRPTLELSAAIH